MMRKGLYHIVIYDRPMNDCGHDRNGGVSLPIILRCLQGITVHIVVCMPGYQQVIRYGWNLQLLEPRK